MAKTEALLRREDLENLLGLRRTAIRNMVLRGELPAPVKVGPRAVRWRKSEVDECLKKLPRADSTD